MTDLFIEKPSSFNSDQDKAWDLLMGQGNVFMTGLAGSGKSYVINAFRKVTPYPVVASTGAAAILVNGCTFHSFFGLGAMQLNDATIVLKASKNDWVSKRICRARGIIIDEVSMLDGRTLAVAEEIARKCRDDESPWGGLRVIAVGDFAQLPPVTKGPAKRDWGFSHDVWRRSNFQGVMLRKVMRTEDREFLNVLQRVRDGIVGETVRSFLDRHVRSMEFLEKLDCPRLYSRKSQVEKYNLAQLAQLEGERHIFPTQYWAKGDDERQMSAIRRNVPIPSDLEIAIGAKVMTRINDSDGRFVNGSTGIVEEIEAETEVQAASVLVRMDRTDEAIWFKTHRFEMISPDGEKLAFAENFPLNLAYACTIHKAQGLSLDEAVVDLRSLWEPGQAYVAISRLTSSKGLHLLGWYPRSIKADPFVARFYQNLEKQSVAKTG